jgi:gentisate 1,2-dioxygenase
MIWFDGLDMPTVIALDAVFFEPHPDASQPIVSRNASERRYGGRGTVPASDRANGLSSPLLNYRWGDTDATLTALAAETREPAVTLRYVNPLTGESALPTLGCAMTRLQPGSANERHAPCRQRQSTSYSAGAERP